IPILHVSGPKLHDLVSRVNDQGVVALKSAASYQDFGNWLDKLDTSEYPAILLLDGIKDSGNLGAILRTAAGAGMAAVLVPKHGKASVNATASITSTSQV